MIKEETDHFILCISQPNASKWSEGDENYTGYDCGNFYRTILDWIMAHRSRISASWNQGIGTPDESASLLINRIPAPAPLGLLAVAGLRGSSGRRD